MMKKLVVFILFSILSFGQEFKYSGFIYNSNNVGVPNIPVKLMTKRIAQYEISYPTYSPNSFNTGTVVASSDDVTHGPFNIGFTFNYFNSNYTQFYIAPNRRLIVSFNATPHYSCRTTLYTFQFVLYETTNVIDIIVASKPLCAGNNATQGLVGPTYTTVVPVGARNAVQWSTTNQTVRFTPKPVDVDFVFYNSYLTDATGKYTINSGLDINPYQFRIVIESLAFAKPLLSDYNASINLIFNPFTPTSKRFYMFDVNDNSVFNVVDSYRIRGFMSGRFLNLTPPYRTIDDVGDGWKAKVEQALIVIQTNDIEAYDMVKKHCKKISYLVSTFSTTQDGDTVLITTNDINAKSINNIAAIIVHESFHLKALHDNYGLTEQEEESKAYDFELKFLQKIPNVEEWLINNEKNKKGYM